VDISAIAALAALTAIAAKVPDTLVGAGTVLQSRQFEDARRAGARFAVGPACTPTLVTAAQVAGLPFLPGIQTLPWPPPTGGVSSGSPPQPPSSNGSSVATGKVLQRGLGSSTCLDD
jgi:hypothetical protein